MAWTAPVTWVGGQIPTAAVLNAQLRDNLLETMPAKATTGGQFFVGNGLNSITTRVPDAKFQDASNTTTSTSYTDLAASGPAVTVTHGQYAVVFWVVTLENTVDNNQTWMSWALSGSNTRAASDNYAIHQDGIPANNAWRIGAITILNDLTPGTTTFTAKYRVGGGTGTFDDRLIGVIPF